MYSKCCSEQQAVVKIKTAYCSEQHLGHVSTLEGFVDLALGENLDTVEPRFNDAKGTFKLYRLTGISL